MNFTTTLALIALVLSIVIAISGKGLENIIERLKKRK